MTSGWSWFAQSGSRYRTVLPKSPGNASVGLICFLSFLYAWLSCCATFFNVGSIALQEVAMYLHAFIFLGASGYTLKHQEHVRVDVFYRTMSLRQKALVNSLGTLFPADSCLPVYWLYELGLCDAVLDHYGDLHRSRRFTCCFSA